MTQLDAITEPGEYKVSKDAYEADPVRGGSLRSSIAWLLVDKTPAHAFHETPLLNPNHKRTEKRHFDLGTIAHRLLLGQGGDFEVIDASDFRSKEARLVRDRAYRVGRTPILEHELREIEEMVSCVRKQMRDMVDYGSLECEPFRDNETERCIVWRETNGVFCRAALDGLSLDGDTLSEFKTEGESAKPEAWQHKARRYGYLFKLCFYMRGLSQLNLAHSPMARFFVAETKAPWLLSMYRVDPDLMEIEHERVMKAIKLWGDCMRSGRWPGYSIDGYDLTLTEREKMRVALGQQRPNNEHVSSEDLASQL